MIGQFESNKPSAPYTHPIPEPLMKFTIKRISSTIICNDETSSSNCTFPPFPRLVRRVIRQCGVQTSVLLIALIYVDRLSKHLPAKAVGTPSTEHRIFLAAILLASKFHEDSAVWCVDIADVVGKYWDILEVAEMEKVFLNYINFDLWVDRKQLANYIKRENIPVDIDNLP